MEIILDDTKSTCLGKFANYVLLYSCWQWKLLLTNTIHLISIHSSSPSAPPLPTPKPIKTHQSPSKPIKGQPLPFPLLGSETQPPHNPPELPPGIIINIHLFTPCFHYTSLTRVCWFYLVWLVARPIQGHSQSCCVRPPISANSSPLLPTAVHNLEHLQVKSFTFPCQTCSFTRTL